jgi:26S proteasome regulatory subunit N2
MTLLEPYLPAVPTADNPATAAGGYAEGGSLFALGLIHGSNAACDSTKRKEACNYLRDHLRFSHANEVISHGASLAVGLTAAGSQDMEIVNELKELLYTDSAVSGEAAGMALGLVLVGSGFGGSAEKIEIVQELKSYAKDTQHEKIIRGIALGMAIMAYGQEEQADATLEEMRGDRDPILRYGAAYGTALAYCGTGSNKAIRNLLHTAVSDVSDDVRMAAVIGLAFVLYKTPERVPQLVKLLLESFNPHVRYAACMAVGIAMSGTGDSESVSMLEPMMDDMTDYVRQGAILGTAMLYMQQSDSCNGRKIKVFREKLSTMLRDKHQSTLTKMGAILGTGLLDAGGRNCSIDLGGSNGFTKMNAAVGLVLWLQHWHWYPMMHMLSLALTPTFTIGMNKVRLLSSFIFLVNCFKFALKSFAPFYLCRSSNTPKTSRSSAVLSLVNSHIPSASRKRRKKRRSVSKQLLCPLLQRKRLALPERRQRKMVGSEKVRQWTLKQQRTKRRRKMERQKLSKRKR